MDWQKITFEDWVNAFNGSQEKWKELPNEIVWKIWWKETGSLLCSVCLLIENCKICPLRTNVKIICCKEFSKCLYASNINDYKEFKIGFIGMQKLLKKLNKKSAYLKWKSKLEKEII